MTKIELQALLAQYQGESTALWAEAIRLERLNGVLAALLNNAEQSGIGFRIAIALVEQATPDLPGALFNLGGARALDVDRLGDSSLTGPATLALSALNTFDSETIEEADTGVGEGTVGVAGAGDPVPGPEIVEGTGAVAVAGEGAPVEAPDTQESEGTVV